MNETSSVDFLSMVDIPYIVCVMTTIYFAIKVLEGLKKTHVPPWWKSAIVIIIGIIYGEIFDQYFDTKHQVLLLSFVVSTFGYDLVMKPLLKKIGINYKEYDPIKSPVKEDNN